MRLPSTVLAATFVIALSASPALADCPAVGRCGTPVPEPSDLALFAGGVMALVIGRGLGKRRAAPADEATARDE